MRESDAMGTTRESQITYDADSVQVRSMRDALGHLAFIGIHPALGVPLVNVDPNGVITRARFDRFGRPLEVMEPGGGGSTLEWPLEA